MPKSLLKSRKSADTATSHTGSDKLSQRNSNVSQNRSRSDEELLAEAEATVNRMVTAVGSQAKLVALAIESGEKIGWKKGFVWGVGACLLFQIVVRVTVILVS